MAGPKYYPILKWKQGEQNALRNLAAPDRALMLPILEVMNAGGGNVMSVLGPTLQRSGVATSPVGLDLRNIMPNGVPFSSLLKLCAAAQKAGHDAHPVISAPDLFGQLGNVAVLAGSQTVILRLRLQLLTLAATLAAIAHVRKAIGRRAQLHVLFDFGPVGEVDAAALAAFAEPFVRGVLAQEFVTAVGMAGGSFPLSLAGFPVGVNNLLPRREWLAWQMLRTRAGCEDVRFGDYNVTNPEPQEIDDPRAMNPAAAIRYALDGEWWLLRARGAKTSGFDQYNTLCRVLVADARYAGAAFSYGDDRYQHHAQPGSTSGNFTTWRRDAASHHLVQTARRLDQLI